VSKKCKFKCGDWNCGSYQFNLYKNDIDQGDLCDVHYWQTKAQRTWVGLTDDEIWGAVDRIGTSDSNVNPYQTIKDARAMEAKLKEKNT
jgi:hypothetical protein